MALAQEPRVISLKTSLGADVLALRRMVATEAMSQLFRFELEVLSERKDIKLSDLLGQPVTVTLDVDQTKERFFHGLVNRFAYRGTHGRYAAYTMTLVPWLWFLTKNSDCRIFQEKAVPDIVMEVFRDRGFTDFDVRLEGSYEKWEYCVQYRESDFNFVTRLMEEEGIYYYFTHSADKHKLVLADSPSSHDSLPTAQIPFMLAEHGTTLQGSVDSWSLAQEVRSGRYALKDYYFETPKSPLLAETRKQREHPNSSFEVFDYPGGYPVQGRGDRLTRVRMEETQATYEIARGSGHVREMLSGALFKLARHPRGDQNREYLALSAVHVLEQDPYESKAEADEEIYHVDFTAMPTSEPFRPPRVTPKPFVQGPQTAVVVGKAGEEIWTDKHGRVKVQFHWDRYGKKDENSSCWIRVSHAWAGKSWGAIYTPRIGQEVIVDFLEGDPDQPIITGRVYNGDNKVPYPLPDEATKSTLKSESSKGGGGYNEFRFEDKKGSEEIFLHAEKNNKIEVLNNEDTTIGMNRTEVIEKGNDSLEIKLGSRMIRLPLGSSLLDAMASITLKVGSNVINISQAGITMTGVTINLIGTAAITQTAPTIAITSPGPLVVKGLPTVIG